MTQSNIESFARTYGMPVALIAAGRACDDASNSMLPPRLFEYWDRFGFSKFLHGCFQILNPADYREVLVTWMSGKPFAESDQYHAVRMDCFGNIRIWGIRTGHIYDIDVGFHAVFDHERDNSGKIKDGRSDRMIESLIFGVSPQDVIPTAEKSDIRLFFAAKDKLGTLGHNQIYAPVPAIPLGGEMRIEDLQIVDAPSYLTMVAEIAPPRVMTMRDLTRLAFGDGTEETLAGLPKK